MKITVDRLLEIISEEISREMLQEQPLDQLQILQPGEEREPPPDPTARGWNPPFDTAPIDFCYVDEAGKEHCKRAMGDRIIGRGDWKRKELGGPDKITPRMALERMPIEKLKQNVKVLERSAGIAYLEACWEYEGKKHCTRGENREATKEELIDRILVLRASRSVDPDLPATSGEDMTLGVEYGSRGPVVGPDGKCPAGWGPEDEDGFCPPTPDSPTGY